MAQAWVIGKGDGLMGPHAATTLRLRNGRRVVEDGPFADTEEQLGGYFVIQGPDLDAALLVHAKPTLGSVLHWGYRQAEDNPDPALSAQSALGAIIDARNDERQPESYSNAFLVAADHYLQQVASIELIRSQYGGLVAGSLPVRMGMAAAPFVDTAVGEVNKGIRAVTPGITSFLYGTALVANTAKPPGNPTFAMPSRPYGAKTKAASPRTPISGTTDEPGRSSPWSSFADNAVANRI